MNRDSASRGGKAGHPVIQRDRRAVVKDRPRSPRWYLGLLIASLILGVVPALSAQDRASEAQVRAFILLRLAGQIYWSPDSDLNERATPYRLCIYQDRGFYRQMRDFLGGREVTGKPVELIQADRFDDLQRCHVAYLGEVSQGDIERILRAGLQQRTVFVGSSRYSASAGLHIRLYLGESDTFDIEINQSAFAAGGNEPSAAFVKLAGKVYGVVEDLNGGRR